MNDLTPDAFALLRAGRTALRPGPPDRERVYRSLIGAIGETTVADAAAPFHLAMAGVDCIVNHEGATLLAVDAYPELDDVREARDAFIAIVAASWAGVVQRDR